MSIRGIAEQIPAAMQIPATVRIETAARHLITRAVTARATVPMSADAVHVQAGQTIRFIAETGGGALSWAPSLVYTR